MQISLFFSFPPSPNSIIHLASVFEEAQVLVLLLLLLLKQDYMGQCWLTEVPQWQALVANYHKLTPKKRNKWNTTYLAWWFGIITIEAGTPMIETC